MFTGLVEARGRVRSVRRTDEGLSFLIEAPLASDLEAGESVAVNGACLTVTRSNAFSFEVDAVRTTLDATTLGAFRAGTEVNLERALRLGDRLGGHIVAGHIDGVGVISRIESGGDATRLTIDVPDGLERFIVEKGSIAVDGVSLTVAHDWGCSIVVALIPETLDRTVASCYRKGTRVNIETDVLARHQAKLEGAPRRSDGEPTDTGKERGITLERLRELGFTE
jgi:riboflavin synthase